MFRIIYYYIELAGSVRYGSPCSHELAILSAEDVH